MKRLAAFSVLLFLLGCMVSQTRFLELSARYDKVREELSTAERARIEARADADRKLSEAAAAESLAVVTRDALKKAEERLTAATTPEEAARLKAESERARREAVDRENDLQTATDRLEAAGRQVRDLEELIAQAEREKAELKEEKGEAHEDALAEQERAKTTWAAILGVALAGLRLAGNTAAKAI